MSLAEIRSALRLAMADLSESWQYRTLTSGPVAETRTYSSWASISALCTGRQIVEEWDDRRQAMRRKETARIRVSDANSELHVGDQVQDTSNAVWAIDGIASQAVNCGTIAYAISRDVPMKGTPRQDGAV